MLQRGSWYIVLTIVGVASCLMSDAVRGEGMSLSEGLPSDMENMIDWRDNRDLQELRDLRENNQVVGLREGPTYMDIKRAFHAMRGKKAAPFHAMRGKKLKGNSGDINTIIAELRRQIMAGKRGEFRIRIYHSRYFYIYIIFLPQ